MNRLLSLLCLTTLAACASDAPIESDAGGIKFSGDARERTTYVNAEEAARRAQANKENGGAVVDLDTKTGVGTVLEGEVFRVDPTTGNVQVFQAGDTVPNYRENPVEGTTSMRIGSLRIEGDGPERHTFVNAKDSERWAAADEVKIDARLNLDLQTGDAEVIQGGLVVIDPETGERRTYEPGDEVPSSRDN